MKTSNFANNKRFNLNGISISRYPCRYSGFKGPEFTLLMPSKQLLDWYKGTAQGDADWEQYSQCYNDQLQCLKAQSVWDELIILAEHYGVELILLCHESSKTLETKPCHRRLVGHWFQEELGVEVPEWRIR